MRVIPRNIRNHVMERDKGRCRICRRKGEHVHHIYSRNAIIPAYLDVPRVPNNNHPLNLMLVCAECHERIHRLGMTRNEKDRWIKRNKILEEAYAKEKKFSQESFGVPKNVQEFLEYFER